MSDDTTTGCSCEDCGQAVSLCDHALARLTDPTIAFQGKVIGELRADIAALRARLEAAEARSVRLAEARSVRLAEALRWYADIRQYNRVAGDAEGEMPPIVWERGARARTALAEHDAAAKGRGVMDEIERLRAIERAAQALVEHAPNQEEPCRGDQRWFCESWFGEPHEEGCPWQALLRALQGKSVGSANTALVPLTYEAMAADCAARGCSLVRYEYSDRGLVYTHPGPMSPAYQVSRASDPHLFRVEAWRQRLHELRDRGEW